jgi:two-component system chemotaxis sensor kinase CheA
MSELLQEFIAEARDFLQEIGEKLMALEDDPQSAELLGELFRCVHTLKGNSGLFDLPEMSKVLHAAEDLMDAVRSHQIQYSQELADTLLDAMDFVGQLLDELETSGKLDPSHGGRSVELVRCLRSLIPTAGEALEELTADNSPRDKKETSGTPVSLSIGEIPEGARLEAFRMGTKGVPLFIVSYRPEEECFFKGEDPFYLSRMTPGLIWGTVLGRGGWPSLKEFDCYRCTLDFHFLCAAPRSELEDHFRYVLDQVSLRALSPLELVIPQGLVGGIVDSEAFVSRALELLENDDFPNLKILAEKLTLELSEVSWAASVLRWLIAMVEASPQYKEEMRRLLLCLKAGIQPDWKKEELVCTEETWANPSSAQKLHEKLRELSPDEAKRVLAILCAQREVLSLMEVDRGFQGRMEACAATISACLWRLGEGAPAVQGLLSSCLEGLTVTPLLHWLDDLLGASREAVDVQLADNGQPQERPQEVSRMDSGPNEEDEALKLGRPIEERRATKALKVDPAKVDQLMNLVGEMVVAKNSLPYLASRAENEFGIRELAHQIKTQYAVINRIVEEMQDAVMKLRMIPLSLILQRFPRMVRDLSRKLGKKVELVLEGGETEVDKNIVDAIAEPLVHLIRNSLDHGIEMPDERAAAGKSACGRIVVRCKQESDGVVIEVTDDGRGIDPFLIKRRAYERGLISGETMERMSDQDAINLIFAPGFSTAQDVSDISGRGVGMDVVRSAVERIGGSVKVTSEKGKGTGVILRLPFSMAVTKVMMVRSDSQVFGVPMEQVLETVRIPISNINSFKRNRSAVLRGRIVPLLALNELLGIPSEPVASESGELAALIIRSREEKVGLLVDDFDGVQEVILKPLPGDLARISCYAGTAILGDGSVLLVINPKEMIQWQ